MLEQELAARFPHWFRGRRARLARPLLRGVGRWSRLDALDGFLGRHRALSGLPLVRAALDFLQADYRIDGHGLESIPAHGACLVVSNHPSGALDALALLDAVGRVRPDVLIVANDVLTLVEGLRPVLLPVEVFGRARSGHARAILAALQRGACVVLFPAGEVARLGWRGIREARWHDGFARLARRSGAPVVPVHVQARNSAVFYGTSAVFKPAATLLLAREMFARRSQPLVLSFGAPVDAGQCADAAALAADLQHRLRSLCGAGTRVAGAQAPACALAAEADAAAVRREVECLERLGTTHDGKQIRLGTLAAGSVLMREIGRLRELTFRAVGEGTGRAFDVDAFDAHYEQLVLWDDAAGRIAGGYRVARVADVLARRGLPGLYTATLFRFDPSAVARLAAGLELGRSFVVPDYWGSRSIDYLWQGIGAYVARHPWVRFLYGPVSISASLPEHARRDVVRYYATWHAGAGDVHARQPYAPGTRDDAPSAAAGFERLRARLAGIGAAVPMLYKQYVDLCEPGGARFLAFNLDPDFSNVVDGLVEVQLDRLKPAKRARYLRAPDACGNALPVDSNP